MAFLVLAASVLVVAYAAICISTASPWPWSQPVHEDGIRTLLGTVFYFEHAARELPLDILLGMTIGGSVLLACPPSDAYSKTDQGLGTVWAALATGLIVAVILGGTFLISGIEGIWSNLFQYHTRPGAPLEWGSHWAYHLLSRISLMLVSVGVVALLRFAGQGARSSRRNRGRGVLVASLALYVLISVLFVSSSSLIHRAFNDPVFLGHQARELFTHALVTVPVAWGLCLVLFRHDIATTLDGDDSRLSSWIVPLSAGLLGAIIGGYVGFSALLNDAASQGQTDDLATLIFPHFFEHGLGYIAVPAVAALTYAIVRDRSLVR